MTDGMSISSGKNVLKLDVGMVVEALGMPETQQSWQSGCLQRRQYPKAAVRRDAEAHPTALPSGGRHLQGGLGDDEGEPRPWHPALMLCSDALIYALCANRQGVPQSPVASKHGSEVLCQDCYHSKSAWCNPIITRSSFHSAGTTTR